MADICFVLAVIVAFFCVTNWLAFDED